MPGIKKNGYKCLSFQCWIEAFSTKASGSRRPETQRCTRKIIICRATNLSKRVWNLHLNLVIVKFSIVFRGVGGSEVPPLEMLCGTENLCRSSRNTWQFASFFCMHTSPGNGETIFRKWLFHVLNPLPLWQREAKEQARRHNKMQFSENPIFLKQISWFSG